MNECPECYCENGKHEADCSRFSQPAPVDPFLEEQEHVKALLESTRSELQTAKTVEFIIANDKFSELSRYALSELRHVMRLLSEGSNFSTARAHTLAPGTLASDISPAEMERDGGDRERALDERLWREEDAAFWKQWFERNL